MMAHTHIVGMTESGKTTLAKALCKKYQDASVSTLILDPLHDPEWCADFKTHDPDEFLTVFWDSRGCAVFVDEAGESVGQFDKVMSKTATKGRHWGHSCHYISQRATQVAKIVRDQCSHLFIFTSSLDDSKMLANEWNSPEIKGANALKQGEYFHVTRFGALTKGNIFEEIC